VNVPFSHPSGGRAQKDGRKVRSRWEGTFTFRHGRRQPGGRASRAARGRPTSPPSASDPSPRSVVFRFEIGSRSPAERPAGANRTPPPPEDDHFPCPRRDHNPGTTHPDERTAHGRTGPPRNNPHFSLKFRDCSLIARTRCRAPMCADPPLRTWERLLVFQVVLHLPGPPSAHMGASHPWRPALRFRMIPRFSPDRVADECATRRAGGLPGPAHGPACAEIGRVGDPR